MTTRITSGRRPSVRSGAALVAGRPGGPLHEVAGLQGEFVNDDRVLVLDVLDRGVELRLERADSAAALYSVNAAGEATEIARRPVRDLGVVAVGPGLRAASMTLERAILVVDLAARRLTRIPMPPKTDYATACTGHWGLGLRPVDTQHPAPNTQHPATSPYRMLTARTPNNAFASD